MKKSSLVTVIALLALVCMGWISHFDSANNEKQIYMEKIALASNYSEKGLYQKAIAEYESVMDLQGDNLLREDYLEVYRKAYDDGVVNATDYGKAILAVCEENPDNVVYWETLLSFYIETENYQSAYQVLTKIEKADVSSLLITELGNKVRYVFKSSNKLFSDFCRTPNGYYAVKDDSGWGVLDSEGNQIVQCEYEYISPLNLDNYAVYATLKDVRLIDEDNIVQAILTRSVVKTGAFGDDMIPLQLENGQWSYYCCTKGVVNQEEYEIASNYIDGIAAVKNETWNLIDKEGNNISETCFSDIKLHGNGDYIYKEKMIAAVNDTYGVYDKEGKLLHDFPCVNADVYLGGYIAFQDSTEKWGFVDVEGNIVLQPTFDDAKSFSNGIAAVCVGGKWGFIDKEGAIVISPQFNSADYLTDGGMCLVSVIEGQYYKIQLRFWED